MKFQIKFFGRALSSAALHYGRAFRGTRYLASIPHAWLAIIILLASNLNAQVQDSLKTITPLEEITVSSVRATSKTPMSFSEISSKSYEKRNLGQDIPQLLNFLPSVVTTSDAGAGIGYTGIRVRGSDATRVNVTINGVPYNDSESQGTFWVNLGDFASSVDNIQLQRGVGTSTNGGGAFGASLHLATDNFSEKAFAEISNSVGSFESRKHTVKFGTGLLNDHFTLSGRLSNIATAGYIDRAAVNLKGYFLQGNYIDKNTQIKALLFGGKEKTYQSWNGIDAETIRTDRTFNSAGMFTDVFGNQRFYDNETDNYQQDHAQLIWNQRFSDSWSSNLSLHYTKGRGYYENYKQGADFSDYGLAPIAGIDGTDLIRQKWLDNDFYGAVFSVNRKSEKLDLTIGGGTNEYVGLHYGKVIWARFASQSELGGRYYEDEAVKQDANIFAKALYKATSSLTIFADMQFRRVGYKANGAQPTYVDDVFNFYNPKAGITYNFSDATNVYLSYARANREPNRTDYENGTVVPEKLNDFELGYRTKSEKVALNANVYYMLYKDQLILTGELDDVGNPIRSNTDKSYRLGLEIDAAFYVLKNLRLQPNITLSTNKNIDLTTNDGTGIKNLGNKSIAYSPEIVAGNITRYSYKGFQIDLLSKFVGKQFLNNIELPSAELPDYFVNDLNISYDFVPKKIFKSIVITALVNNLLDRKYLSNGYMYGADPYYYPQAGINFLAGLTLKF